MRSNLIIALGILVALLVAACTPPPVATVPTDDSATVSESQVEAKDIVDTAVAAGDFTTLVAAVQAAGSG